jgi:DNA (cytosine-5)-methyltransferase 1
MSDYKILDLFCGAGGASAGLKRAFGDRATVTGVDHVVQPRYPFEFIQADALTFDLSGFDFIWASPKCQAHSWSAKRWNKYFDNQIPTIRKNLKASGLPYIIENVQGAPLENPVTLCGEMFGLNVIRHRLFESNLLLFTPFHPKHKAPVIRPASGDPSRSVKRSAYCTVAGNGGESGSYKLSDWREAMGIDWMTKSELTQAIPPAFSEYLGKQIINYLERVKLAA